MAQPFILIVDDNKITLKLLRKYLEANGFEVEEAYDGIDCLEKVDKRSPDAIVLDVMMPRLDGYETVKRLKEQKVTNQIPVIIVTALNDVSNQIKSIDAGADDFLSKPIEEKLLIAKVRLLSNFALEMKRSQTYKALLNKIVTRNIDISNKSIEELLVDFELN
jgi:two-component system, sensor histidine kinase and response regulator